MQHSLHVAVTVGDLTYDPGTPDRVWVTLTEGARGVLSSTDGGASWVEAGPADPGRVNALTLGIDARNLYVATDQRLWRLRL